MEDRVRIYELARRMNLPNQDVINTFRELGYDVKSHSSTVDSQAVGLFIAHLGKKKSQQAAKTGKTTKTVKTSKGPANKTTATVVTPPPVVKPRVLSRYRPTPLPSAEATGEQTPAASIEMLPVNDVPAKVSESQPSADSTESSANKATVIASDHLAVKPSKASEAILEQANVHPGHEATVHQDTELATAIEPHEELVPSTKELESFEQEESSTGEEETEEPHSEGTSGLGLKPMAPSVPVRIAAPSFRATPPRAPKHRPTPVDRHVHKREEKSKPAAVTIEVPKIIAITAPLTVIELSEKMAVSETEIIKRLFMKGFMRTVNQMVELELACDLAVEMGYEIQSLEERQAQEALEKLEQQEAVKELSADEKAALVPRPPVVTIMGHVDHGKTSLLDAIRQTKFLLTDAEAGGITQHIGAYHVEVPGDDGQLRQVVFLDTPGHEAFTAMRARGARCTDIAILVVAADDGVMPQTIEAIDHAKAAGVPIIVAVNKIDKPGADPDRVLSQLMEHGLLPDKFGGETVTVNVSAKKRTGLDELLEMILLVADMQELKANPERSATGAIIEAKLHRGKGTVVTALVLNGTLRLGDFIVAGNTFGRVRALLDDRGQQVRAAGPSMPVEVLGLPEVPMAGDKFEVVDDLQLAKQLAEARQLSETERYTHRVTLESLHELVEQGEVKELNIIIKADVQGTAEAIGDQIRKLSAKEVQVRVLRTASGDISENDVNLAASSNAIIIGFNVQPDTNASRAAETAAIDIHTYSIIYEIIDHLNLAIQGLLQPIKQELHIGIAEIRQVFKLSKSHVVAGCYITSGKITRGALVRITRADEQIYEGKIETLRRFKDDVREVAQGFECGMSFEKLTDVQIGDIINAHIIQEVKREISR